MTVPREVLVSIRSTLWRRADDADWDILTPSEKTIYYENWSRDAEIGGRLANYMDVAAVRVYIKDTLLKAYTRERESNLDLPKQVLKIPGSLQVDQRYIKPHGARFEDGRVVAWGKASNWKHVLLAVHERTFNRNDYWAHGIMLTHALPRYEADEARRMVEDAAKRLDIKVVAWLD